MKERHGVRDRDEILQRETTDPGSIADGDAPIANEPPNVTAAEPPAQEVTRGAGGAGGAGGARPGPRTQPGASGAGASAAPPVDVIADTEGDAVAEMRQIENDLDVLRRDFSTLSDRHIRLAAEFDNYRKRIERERAESWGRAQADLAGRLLDALDDLRRVSDHADTSSPEALTQGVVLVERKLRQALQAAGLETIDVEGARFDPNSMEAVAMLGTDSQEEDEMVSDVFQPGYRFKGTLLRPARVRVKKFGA